MAIDERIRFLRNLRGMTQKYLGVAIGFPEKTADIRIAQYESGTRAPKADVTNALANVLKVSPQALTVPDIDSYDGIMHTLFTMEDLYGIRIDKLSDEVCIRLDKGMSTNYITMFEMFSAWQKQSEKLKSGEISKEEYDQWRYNYPKSLVENSDMENR
ncbi:helix-turn-helix domain-containing protein [Fannyhessea vaginae]|uniref:helix-turn-helix domain-containing protein n=1 Tax=Fannyhessea vaginae TaxID=82135 RepID=UPI0023F46781|nr:helix-turn-helix transcriptional regulator [Fannyhessea vaginae]